MDVGDLKHLMQAMNAKEAREMLLASMQKPNLVAQVVPSPITFKWDATIQQTLKEQQLGDLLYVEVSAIEPLNSTPIIDVCLHCSSTCRKCHVHMES